MRKCIKCGDPKPLGMFNDNWRHKVNTCKDCERTKQHEYAKDNPRVKLQSRLGELKRQVEELERKLYGDTRKE